MKIYPVVIVCWWFSHLDSTPGGDFTLPCSITGASAGCTVKPRHVGKRRTVQPKSNMNFSSAQVSNYTCITNCITVYHISYIAYRCSVLEEWWFMFEHCVNLVFFNFNLHSYLFHTTYLIISCLAIFFGDNQRRKTHIFCAASPPEASRALQGAGHVGGAQHPDRSTSRWVDFCSGEMMRKWEWMTSGMAAVAKKKESFGDLGQFGLQNRKMSCTFSADDTHDPTTNDEFRNAHGRCSGKERKMKGSSPTKQCDIFQNTFDYRQTKSKETPPDLETWCFQWEFDESTFAGDWFQRSSGFLWFPPHLGWRSSKLYILFSYYFSWDRRISHLPTANQWLAAAWLQGRLMIRDVGCNSKMNGMKRIHRTIM